jgi:hypothetical protein
VSSGLALPRGRKEKAPRGRGQGTKERRHQVASAGGRSLVRVITQRSRLSGYDAIYCGVVGGVVPRRV